MAVTYGNFGGRIVSEVRDGVERDYVRDTLGSTAALVDSTGTITDTWTYWPYGEIRSRTGTHVTPFSYVGTLGYYRDSALRAYIRARHYLQILGRWLTVDPRWPLLAPFEYAHSDPLRRVDPSGLNAIPAPIPISAGLIALIEAIAAILGGAALLEILEILAVLALIGVIAAIIDKLTCTSASQLKDKVCDTSCECKEAGKPRGNCVQCAKNASCFLAKSECAAGRIGVLLLCNIRVDNGHAEQILGQLRKARDCWNKSQGCGWLIGLK